MSQHKTIPAGCRPATSFEYEDWLDGFVARDQRVDTTTSRKFVDDEVLLVEKNMRIPAAFGAASRTYIVPAGVDVTYGDLGHNQVLFMDGFRVAGSSYITRYAPDPNLLRVPVPHAEQNDLTDHVILAFAAAYVVTVLLIALLVDIQSSTLPVVLAATFGITTSATFAIRRWGRSHITPWLYRTFSGDVPAADPTYQALLDRSYQTEHGDPHTIICQDTSDGVTVNIIRADHDFHTSDRDAIPVTIVKTVPISWTAGDVDDIIAGLADEARDLEAQSDMTRRVEQNLLAGGAPDLPQIDDLETEFRNRAAEAVRYHR